MTLIGQKSSKQVHCNFWILPFYLKGGNQEHSAAWNKKEAENILMFLY